jgi:predicted lipoprotein with Yx(FWY)xxD motif
MTPTDAVHARTFRSGIASRLLVRRGLVPAAVLAGSLGATTFAGASQPKPVVTTAKVTGLGTVLVASHRVLYAKANDPKGKSTCTGGCATIWPPLIVSSRTAHLGHIAGLGTIKRSNGKLQVAIHGHALYFNAGDHSQSQTNGQGFQNNWFTVHANGSLDRTTTSAPMATVPSTSQPAPSPTSSSSTTRPTSAPAGSAPISPPPTSPPPTSPPPTSPPTTSPPPPTTTTAPPTTTTTTSGGGGGVGF